MDILYVLGKGSKHNNIELRYSLRSIERYGINVGKVYLVGYDPGFLSDKVTFIPCDDKYMDKYNGKHKNIIAAICHAVENSDIGEEFLYSSDDHIYIKETNFDLYPYFCRGNLPERPAKFDDKRSEYHFSLLETRELLTKHGLTCYRFSQHGNTHMSRSAIRNAMPLIKESFNGDYGCEPTCIILNSLYSYKPFLITTRADLKLGKERTVDFLLEHTRDREVFSICDNPDESIWQYLNKLFPDKSKYEAGRIIDFQSPTFNYTMNNIVEPCCAERQLGQILREERGHAVMFQTNGDVTAKLFIKDTMLLSGDRPRTLTIASSEMPQEAMRLVCRFASLGYISTLRLMVHESDIALHPSFPDCEVQIALLPDEQPVPELMMWRGSSQVVVIQGAMPDVTTPALHLYSGLLCGNQSSAVRAATDAFEALFRARRYYESEELRAKSEEPKSPKSGMTKKRETHKKTKNNETKPMEAVDGTPQSEEKNEGAA